MKLSLALRLYSVQPLATSRGASTANLGEPSSPRLALVGAGGKSSALFRLGRELCLSPGEGGSPVSGESLGNTVLLCATTHLASWQLHQADHHYIFHDLEDLAALETNLPAGLVLFTGPPAEAERTAGLDELSLARLKGLADGRRLPLLIEADGSRQRPFKAPAGHEPVIPPWVDTVVVVAGLSALGRPLSPQWVHRPERFAALSGLTAGETLTLEELGRVLAHPQGGLKGIPAGARRVALLNQADTAALQGAASRLAGELLGAYDAVLVAALAPPVAGDGTAAASGVYAAHEPVAGIVLAGGGAERYGAPKQLLTWEGEPLVRRAASTALVGGLSPVVVVTGAYAEDVTAALQGLDVVLAHNPGWSAGQSTSVIAGVKALPPQTGAALFLLADQPHVPAALLRSLVESHTRTLAPLVAPQAGGRRANPVLFDRLTFPDLLALRGDVGGRALFSRYPVAWLPWLDSSLLMDVDTEEDYRRLLASGEML